MKHRMLAGAAALAGACGAAAQPAPDAAARWTLVSEDREAEYFYDPGSVERLGGMIRYRMRAVVHPERPGQMRAAVVAAEINCAEQTIAYLGFELTGRGGAPLQSAAPDGGRADVEPIRFGSPEEILYMRLCPESLVRPIVPQTGPPIVMVSPPPPVALPPVPPPPVPPPPMGPPAQPFERAQWLTPLASLVTQDDYPSAALGAGAEGTVRVSLRVSRQGHVTACTVTSSSRSSVLDAATCQILASRARFTPARDERGRTVADTVAAGVRWVIPADPEPEPAEGPAQPPDEQS